MKRLLLYWVWMTEYYPRPMSTRLTAITLRARHRPRDDLIMISHPDLTIIGDAAQRIKVYPDQDIIQCQSCRMRIAGLPQHPIMGWPKVISNDDLAAVLETHGNFYFCQLQNHISYWRALYTMIILFHASGNCYLVENPPTAYEHLHPTSTKKFSTKFMSADFRLRYVAICESPAASTGIRLDFVRWSWLLQWYSRDIIAFRDQCCSIHTIICARVSTGYKSLTRELRFISL